MYICPTFQEKEKWDFFMVNDNGILKENAQLNPFNRGFLYGDAVFETIKAVNGKLLFWEDHYFRLMAAMRIMRMEIPMDFTPEFLEQQLIDLLDATDLMGQAARLRLTVYRNGDGTYLPLSNEVGYYAFAKAHPYPFYTLNDQSYEVELYKDHYLSADLLSTIKSTNRAINVTGSIFAKENNFDNCLLINTNKSVVEALNGNLFLVKGMHIKTPPLEDGCLRGIIRKQLLSMLTVLTDYTFDEASISPFELQKADELFITNTIIGIQPITRYRKKQFDSAVASDLLKKLNVNVRLG